MQTSETLSAGQELNLDFAGQDSTDNSISGLRSAPFTFNGTGSEYFRIWIVNLMLTIVTLGVYSAWAKVRNKQYFYGNTSLEGSTFSYMADPKKILLGRMIAAAFLLLYVLAEHFSLTLSAVMIALFFLLLPWVVCRALRFNAVNSAYRNVSFNFRGTVGQAYIAFLVWPLAGMITLGLLIPYAICKQQQFIYGNHSYGTSQFQLHAGPWGFYRLYFGLIFAGIGVFLGIAASIFALSMIGMAPLAGFIVALGYLALFALFQVRMANIRYQNIALDEHQMDSNWSLHSYLWLIATNGLAILFSLGMLIPWAKVRTARYKAEHTWCLVAGNLDDIVAKEQASTGSVSEGMSDLFGIDVGI